ncbi:kinase-like domain-containing protein [Cladochytrium replicatum]|nr:kinase-like domain-containing protein [Cladochytrium replicatum]
MPVGTALNHNHYNLLSEDMPSPPNSPTHPGVVLSASGVSVSSISTTTTATTAVNPSPAQQVASFRASPPKRPATNVTSAAAAAAHLHAKAVLQQQEYTAQLYNTSFLNSPNATPVQSPRHSTARSHQRRSKEVVQQHQPTYAHSHLQPTHQYAQYQHVAPAPAPAPAPVAPVPQQNHNPPAVNGADLTARAQPLVGTVIEGDLKLLDIIGSGSFAVVFLAEHLYRRTRYAVKCMFKDGLDDLQLAAQRREAAMLAKLKMHPNIIHLHKVIDAPTCLLLVLEFCELDLYEAITQQGGFPDDVVKEVFAQLADAILHCHRNNIYHRDLKPENVLISPDYRIKLADFGLATTHAYSNEHGCGSVRYMAPETLDNRTMIPYSASANDCWSLGVILVNLLFGKNPWHQASLSDPIFGAYVGHNPNVLRDHFGLSREFDSILRGVFCAESIRCTVEELRDRVLNCRRFTDGGNEPAPVPAAVPAPVTAPVSTPAPAPAVATKVPSPVVEPAPAPTPAPVTVVVKELKGTEYPSPPASHSSAQQDVVPAKPQEEAKHVAEDDSVYEFEIQQTTSEKLVAPDEDFEDIPPFEEERLHRHSRSSSWMSASQDDSDSPCSVQEDAEDEQEVYEMGVMNLTSGRVSRMGMEPGVYTTEEEEESSERDECSTPVPCRAQLDEKNVPREDEDEFVDADEGTRTPRPLSSAGGADGSETTVVGSPKFDALDEQAEDAIVEAPQTNGQRRGSETETGTAVGTPIAPGWAGLDGNEGTANVRKQDEPVEHQHHRIGVWRVEVMRRGTEVVEKVRRTVKEVGSQVKEAGVHAAESVPKRWSLKPHKEHNKDKEVVHNDASTAEEESKIKVEEQEVEEHIRERKDWKADVNEAVEWSRRVAARTREWSSATLGRSTLVESPTEEKPYGGTLRHWKVPEYLQHLRKRTDQEEAVVTPEAVREDEIRGTRERVWSAASAASTRARTTVEGAKERVVSFGEGAKERVVSFGEGAKERVQSFLKREKEGMVFGRAGGEKKRTGWGWVLGRSRVN